MFDLKELDESDYSPKISDYSESRCYTEPYCHPYNFVDIGEGCYMAKIILPEY